MALYQGVAYAAPPPAGVTPNASAPVEAASLITVIGVFLPMAVFTTGVRLYTRIAIIRQVAYDDHLMVIALLLSVIFSALVLDMMNYGLGKHMWDVPLDALYPNWRLNNVLAAMSFCAATGLAKGSILLFYLRIFPNRGMFVATWAAFAFTLAYSVASVLVNLFSCHPVSGSWKLEESLTAVCINRPLFYFAQAALGITTDFTTLVLPLPMLKSLRLPWKQKIAAAFVLSTGAFVCVISIIRLKSLFKLLTDPDLTMNTVSALMWCILELNLSIIGGSIPALKPFLQQFFPRLLSSPYIRNSESNGHAERYYTGESQLIGMVGGHQRKASECAGGSQSTKTRGVSSRMVHGDAGSEEFIMQDSIVKTIQYDVQFDPVADADESKSSKAARDVEFRLGLHI